MVVYPGASASEDIPLRSVVDRDGGVVESDGAEFFVVSVGGSEDGRLCWKALRQLGNLGLHEPLTFSLEPVESSAVRGGAEKVCTGTSGSDGAPAGVEGGPGVGQAAVE